MSPRGKDIAVSASTVSAKASTGRQDPRRWWALAAVSLAAFMTDLEASPSANWWSPTRADR